jgi:hypothetical protein
MAGVLPFYSAVKLTDAEYGQAPGPFGALIRLKEFFP